MRFASPLIAHGAPLSGTSCRGECRGQHCGVALNRYERHAGGQCGAGGIGTCIHHAARRRLAASCRAAGLRAEEDIGAPYLHSMDDDGKATEARMDI